MFYDGLSLSDIARTLDQTYNNPVNPSTVHRWLIRYTVKSLNILEPIKPQVSDTWVVDETVIDEGTRFLLADLRGLDKILVAC